MVADESVFADLKDTKPKPENYRERCCEFAASRQVNEVLPI
jgi:hypothetical protein